MKNWVAAGITAAVLLTSAVAATPIKMDEPDWIGAVDQADPRDLNHAEAVAFHARWSAQVKAAVEAEAKRREEAAEAARKATQVKPAPPSTTRVVSPPTRVVPAPVQKTPVPASDPWMDTYNRLSSSLPGTWHIGDKGSWGATAPDNGNVWIARRTPLYALPGVMLHESCHVRQGRVFGGYAGAVNALASYGGLERTADACARLMDGSVWIGYGVDAKAFEGARLF